MTHKSQSTPRTGESTAAIRAVACHVSLPVLDLEAAERFYVTAFAASIASRFEGLTNLRVGSHRLSLRKVDTASTSLQTGAEDRLRARHWGFGVSVPREVDAASQVLLALGATSVLGPVDRDDGRTFVCCDPSGNQLEIYYERRQSYGKTVRSAASGPML
jgi:extradiol dioxygenase family protein